MTALRVWLSRMLGSLAWRSREADLQADIQAHLDLLLSEYQQKGMPLADARLAARRAFGAVAPMQETYRDQRRLPGVDTILQDIRYALRTMRRAPAFTAIAVLTLALGIGANTAIFQVLHAIVLKPLPVREPDRLVALQGYHDGHGQGFSLPLVREMAARQSAVEGIFVSGSFSVRELTVDGRSPLKPAEVRLATGGYFRLLGTDPQVGRFFTEVEDQPSALPVAVISDAFWRREFGGRADAVGHVLLINKVHVTIVGVTRRQFFGESVGRAPDAWVPMSLVSQFSPATAGPSVVWLFPMARIRPDVPLPRAQTALDGLYKQLKHFSIQTKGVTDYRLELLPARQGMGSLHQEFATPLWILMGIAALLALIACCNVANLLLARATARTHEIGVRLALGAGRARLIRQALTESMVLAGLGAGAAFFIAAPTARSLVGLAASGQDLQLSIDPDWRVAAFTASVCVAAVITFGLIPALTTTRIGAGPALQSNRRTHSGGRRQYAMAKAFVVAQVTLSLMLVAGASLLTRSFLKLTHQDFGYRPERVLTAYLDFDWENRKAVFSSAFRDALYRNVRAIPGIRSASLSMGGPLGNLSDSQSMALPETMPAESDEVSIVRVSPHYFETMGIRIVAGRPIAEDDRKGAPSVAVISETTARRFFGTANPLGRVFTFGRQFDAARTIQVVGVADDVRYGSPREPFRSLVFIPMEQIRAFSVPEIVLQADGNPMVFGEAVRRAVTDAAPGLGVWRVSTLSETVMTELRRERMLAWLSGAFGVLALMLASVGLYGVVCYGVELRTQEIGIRLALGATRERVRRLLLGEVLQMVGLGLAAGGVATLALTGLLRSILFELSPRDPLTLASAALVLTSVGVLASFVPARRASRLDPMVALRRE